MALQIPVGGCVISRPAAIRIANQAQGFALLSDLHIGSPQVLYSQITSELLAADRNGDRVLLNGDVFDAIVARDPRHDPDCLAKRLQGRKDILNAALEWAEELLAPFAARIDVIGCGNHETAVERHHSVDLIALLCDRLARHGSRAVHGGYTGFVDYRLKHQSHTRRFVVWYHHGHGGGGSLGASAGALQSKSWVEGAQVIWLGHRHARLSAHTQRLSCPKSGHSPRLTDVRLVQTGAYMTPYAGQSATSIRHRGRRGNYAADAGLTPYGLGGTRVVLKFNRDGYTTTVEQ